jgi:hypothetical protein
MKVNFAETRVSRLSHRPMKIEVNSERAVSKRFEADQRTL